MGRGTLVIVAGDGGFCPPSSSSDSSNSSSRMGSWNAPELPVVSALRAHQT
jgi:hypothetical protein